MYNRLPYVTTSPWPEMTVLQPAPFPARTASICSEPPREPTSPVPARAPSVRSESPVPRGSASVRGTSPVPGDRAEAVRVCVRMRPPPTEAEGWCLANSNKVQRITRGREIFRNDGSLAWKWDDRSITLNPTKGEYGSVRTAQQFTFSHLWGMHVPTTELYREVGLPIVQQVFEGYNGCIMAYGQTNSGKTFTISGHGASPGFITMAVNDFFDHIRNTPDRVSLLRVSFLEVYNEQLKDLLADDQPTLVIMDDHEGRVKVGNVTEKVVSCLQDVKDLAAMGEACRMFGRNNVHEHASRSHTIFQLIFESRHVQESTVRVSTLSVVDLAGSEHTSLPLDFSRQTEKKKAERALQEVREREGNNIRKSLLALSRVVSTLATAPKDHIPYRDSKLTRILRPALGGNSSTVIIATINPWMSDTDDKETSATLRFAFTAQQISNHPHQVAVTKDEGLLDYYQTELRELQTQMLLINTQNVGVVQEKEVLASRLQQEDAKRAELLKKYQNLSQFILTSNSFPAEASQGSRAASAPLIRYGKRRRNSFDCLRDAKSLSLERQYGYLKNKPPDKKEKCSECALKDSMIASLQRQLRLNSGAAEERDALRRQLHHSQEERRNLLGQLEHAASNSSALVRQREENHHLQAQKRHLEEAKIKLESEVGTAMRELKEKEAVLLEARRAVDEKVREIEAKQRDLRQFEERTAELQQQIEAQQQENGELEEELRHLCGETLAFQRYYELKKQNRHFKTIRKVFEKEKPSDYKPWMQYMPSEHTVERTISAIRSNSQTRGPGMSAATRSRSMA
eukprot:EG_transcript_1341